MHGIIRDTLSKDSRLSPATLSSRGNGAAFGRRQAATMQVIPQHTQAPIPTGAYAVDPPSASRRQYSQQSPQSGELDRLQSSTRTTSSPQSSRQPSKRPSGNATQPNNPDTSQQAPYQSSGDSYHSNSSTPRNQDMSATTRASTIVPISVASPSFQPT